MVPLDELERADSADRTATAVAALEATPDSEKKNAVTEAARMLSPEQQLDLAKELAARQWPTGDTAKAVIYITGFLTAGAVLVGAGLIGWQAQGEEGSIASDLIVAASALVSLLIGGLVGAYVQR
jgi:hypothetical protein